MKQYSYNLNARQRFTGYSTQDKDVSIGFSNLTNLKDETKHKHTESDEIYLTVKGKGKIKINEKTYEMKKGEAIRVEKEEVHEIISINEKPFEFYSVKVPDEKDDKIEV